MDNKGINTVTSRQLLESKGVKLPKFVYRILDKLLHVNHFNKYLEQGFEGVEFCTNALKFIDVKIEVSGLENLSDDGTMYTFASNHPLGGIDGIALGSVVGSKFKAGVTFLANDLLLHLKGLAPLCVPVNVTGAQSRDSLIKVDGAFRGEKNILIFPAGMCSRLIDGKIQDVPWTKAFLRKSIETGRSIVPVHIIARNSRRFYLVAKISDFLHLELAMALLPDECYRASHKTFRIVFGKPIAPSFFDSSKTPLEWAQWVRSEVYKLS